MYINNPGHMTKMATMSIYGNLLRNWWADFNETWHEVSMTQVYNIYINQDPVMTLTYFTARLT